MPITPLGETLFLIGQAMEVVGVLRAMLGLGQEWRLFSGFVARIVARFKKPADQVLQGQLFERTITDREGMIDQIDVWPSQPDQQIAWLKSRIDTDRKRIEEQIAETTKNVAELEARMNRRVVDVEQELSGLANDLSQFKKSNWVPRLGGTLLAGAGVVVTVVATLIG